jgi:hypothetical protein
MLPPLAAKVLGAGGAQGDWNAAISSSYIVSISTTVDTRTPRASSPASTIRSENSPPAPKDK